MCSSIERVHVHVLDDVYELIGEISSSEREVEIDQQLERYLVDSNGISPGYQGMARTKQTQRRPVTTDPLAGDVDELNMGDKDPPKESKTTKQESLRRGRSAGHPSGDDEAEGERIERKDDSESSEGETPTSSEESLEEDEPPLKKVRSGGGASQKPVKATPKKPQPKETSEKTEKPTEKPTPRKPCSTKISEETLPEPEEKVEPRKPRSGKATEEASKPGKPMKRPRSEASTSAQPEQAEETEPPRKKSQKRE